MEELGVICLKELVEDFYINEISNELNLDEKNINYINNDEIYVKNEVLSKKIKKHIFSRAEDRVIKYLSEFSCSKNKDVETYLHNNAIRMQKENISRTYLILNLENNDIVAYFTLAIKAMKLREQHNISTNKKKDLKTRVDSGFDDELFFCFLIGQIGRNDSYTKETIRLEGILNYVFAYINEVKSLIGGRIILIEVEGDDSDTLINRYKSVGFDSFGKLEDLTQLMIFTKSY